MYDNSKLEAFYAKLQAKFDKILEDSQAEYDLLIASQIKEDDILICGNGTAVLMDKEGRDYTEFPYRSQKYEKFINSMTLRMYRDRAFEVSICPNSINSQ